MKAYFQLTLRRERSTLLGLAAAAAVTLPLAALGAHANGMPAKQGIDAALLFWGLLGLPLSALLLGCSIASSCRAAQDGPEAFVPLPPERRARAAALGAFALWAALAGAVLAAALAVGVKAGGLIPSGQFEETLVASWVWLTAVISAYALLAGFAATYALGHAIAGGLAVVVLTLPPSVAAIAALMTALVHGGRVSPVAPFALAAAILFGAAAWVLPRAARAVDRGVLRWRTAAGLAAALIASSALAAFLGAAYVGAVMDQLDFTEASDGPVYWPKGEKPPVGEPAGVYLASLRGALAYAEPSGRVTPLLPAERRPFDELIAWTYDPVQLVYRLRGGRVLLVRRDETGARVLWYGPERGPLVKLNGAGTVYLSDVIDRKERTEIVAYTDKGDRIAQIRVGKPLLWRPLARKPAADRTLDHAAAFEPIYSVDDKDEGAVPAAVAKPGDREIIHPGDRDEFVLSRGRRIERLDVATGKVLGSWPVDDAGRRLGWQLKPYVAARDGVFARRGGTLLFVGWNGESRLISLPR